MPETISHNVVIVGAGGHAKVVIDVLRRMGGYNIVGCIDRTGTGSPILGAAIIGCDDRLAGLRREGVTHAFVAVGDNGLRGRLGALLKRADYALATAVSPEAYVAESAVLGEAVAVMAGAVIQPDAQIHDFAIVNTAASVDHDCVVAEASHVAPGVRLCGGVRIGARCLIGAGAVVSPGVTIGADTIVGAGASVIRDVPSGVTVVGNPARVVASRRTSEE